LKVGSGLTVGNGPTMDAIVSITITTSISTSGWWGSVGVCGGDGAVEGVMNGGGRLIGRVRR